MSLHAQMAPSYSAEIAAVVDKTRHAILSKINTTTVSERQGKSLKDPGVQARMWVSRVVLAAPQPENGDACQRICDAISYLGKGNEEYKVPAMLDVAAEWTGYRPRVDDNAPEPSIPEVEKFNGLMRDVENQITILYLHGGAFFLNSPASYRNITVKLAELTKSRCFAVRYRLAPQNAFPAALLDTFVAYLSLLYPPPDSIHSSVAASSIILAGDSSGATLALGLVQVILALQRIQCTPTPMVCFHGQNVAIPMPAGATLQSLCADQTFSSLPSWSRNACFDILQNDNPVLRPDYPSCPIWPSIPPRGDLYCETSMICHPLVSPATALDWAGAPPVWFAIGEERMSDGAKAVAQAMANQGVTVQWEEYKHMPHNWPVLFSRLWQATRCMGHWGEACKLFAGDRTSRSKGEIVELDGSTRSLEVTHLIELNTEAVLEIMKMKQAKMRTWTGRQRERSLI